MVRICTGEVWVRSRMLSSTKEGVLHVTRGMVLRKVEGFEVVVIELDLGPFGYLKAECRQRFRVISSVTRVIGCLVAEWPATTRQGHIDSFSSAGFRLFWPRGFESRRLRIASSSWSLTELTTWPMSGRSSGESDADPLHDGGKRTLLPEVLDPQFLKLFFGCDTGKFATASL